MWLKIINFQIVFTRPISLIYLLFRLLPLVCLPVLSFGNQPQIVSPVGRIHQLIDNWQISQAQDAYAKLAESRPKDPEVKFIKVRLDFNYGNFKAAQVEMEKLPLDSSPGLKRFQELISKTVSVVRDYQNVEGEHFSVFFPPGKDEILPEYTLQALEAGFQKLTRMLEVSVPEKVQVFFLSGPKQLSQVSTLQLDAIETTGTIAICKFNRLMVISPRAMLLGYRWLDTLVHEFVHFLINKKTSNRVPIWLHEGLARYLETRWRSDAPEGLSPTDRSLLRLAALKGKLITFQQMHPSMALLPSQEDSTLAFAEVYSLIDFLVKKQGTKVLARILGLIAAGKDAQQAVADAMDTDFSVLEKNWKQSLKNVKVHPGVRFNPREFAIGRDKQAEKGLKKDLEARRAGRFFHLGELLRQRGFKKSAIKEFEKAMKEVEKGKEPHPRNYPLLINRLARLLLELKEFRKARPILEDSVKLYPDFLYTYLNLGRWHLINRNYQSARDYYQQGLAINPFNPEIHLALAKIYKEMGQPEAQEREQQIYHKLQRYGGY